MRLLDRKDWCGDFPLGDDGTGHSHQMLLEKQALFATLEIDKYSRVAFPNVRGISGRLRIKQKFYVL